MAGRTHRSAFTLIEVLIVVVIMAVLAATIIPQFSTSTKDARESSLKFNLQSLRTQIELYKVQHAGAIPTIATLTQLTLATDATGAVGTTVPDTTHPFGPYIQGALPMQPFSNSNAVRTVTVPGAPNRRGCPWRRLGLQHRDRRNLGRPRDLPGMVS